MKKNFILFKGLFVEFLLWIHSFLILKKVIYEKFILNTRYLSFNWNELLFCAVAGLIVSVLIFFITPNLSVGRALYFKELRSKKLTSSPFFYNGLFHFILTLITSIYISQVSLKEFFSSEGLQGAQRIFMALATPNFGIINETIFSAVETIYIAFLATILSIPFAFFLSFFSSKNLVKNSPFFRITYSLLRLFMNLSRSIEPLIWAIIFSVWVGIGPFSGMLALWVHSIASLTKLYSEQIEAIDEGLVEAIAATGAHPIQIIWFGVVPQIVIPFMSFTIYRWDINVRMATIIGLVGGGGIGTLLMQYQGMAMWHEVGLLVIVIALIVWLMDFLSSKVRESIK
jgi:phosphonate transport system permease protein